MPVLRTLLLATLYSIYSTFAQAEETTHGSAIVTSRSGSVEVVEADGSSLSTDAHTVLRPSGLTWSTQGESRIFITFSNGVALSLDSESSVQCLKFIQRPFNLDDIEVGREPSVSEIQLQFESGRIAIASNKLSPLSQLRIVLPYGEARLHKGSCLIAYDAMGIHLTAFEGNLTYYYPNSDAREYVTAPRSVRISEQSASRQQIAEASTTETIEASAVLLSQATEHASQRVFFQPNAGTGEPAEPVLVVRPEYFDQPVMRPYTFED